MYTTEASRKYWGIKTLNRENNISKGAAILDCRFRDNGSFLWRIAPEPALAP